MALSVNDTAWNLLYGGLINALGVSPSTFQLLYPMTSWNWVTNLTGYTSAEQYDFCAAIPQWSATGAYVSAGTKFDTSYGQFLNNSVPAGANPTLAQEILTAQNNATQALNNYNQINTQVASIYASAVPGGTPTYTAWLGTAAGAGYQIQINSAFTAYTTLNTVVTQLLSQVPASNLYNAQGAFQNKAYQTQMTNPGLTTFPLVPQWDLGQTSAAWVTQVTGGGGTGGTVSFSNSNAAYDYSQTWAQGSASASGWFWQVNASGSWQQDSIFSSDSSLQVSIAFKAWDTISITPSQWYSGTVPFKNGPFNTPWTAFGKSPASYMFGEGGLVPLLKTGMLVCYQPTITIQCSQATYAQFQSQWSAALDVQVGPFQSYNSAGGSSLNWNQTGSTMTCVATSDSTTPLIFGINVAVEPM